MSISQERDDRAEHRAKIEALFLAHPLTEIQNAILKAITPHYQQRISECRRLGMDIRNVPVFVPSGVPGRMKRLDGNYKFHPTPGAREGTTPAADRWPLSENYATKFELT